MIAQYLLSIKFAVARGRITDQEVEEYLGDLKKLPDQIELLLSNQTKIQKFANRYIAAKDVFFIGRGIDYAISMEGSLKLKEISYVHSEAYAAGELKHGTISLIEDGTLVVAVATQEDLYKKNGQQHGRGKNPWSLCYGSYQRRQYRYRKGSGLCDLHSTDE